jgi:hypothetical protein
MIGLRVRGITTEIGPGGLLHSFCSSVAVHLEQGGWGSVFPVLQNELYDGHVPASHAGALLEELRGVRAGLSKVPPDGLVWDIEDRSAAPPWDAGYGPHITDLAVFYVNTGQRNLIDVLSECAQLSIDVQRDIELISYRDSPAEVPLPADA